MNATSYVTQASEWAGELIRSESRGPGDLDNAMRRVERRSGVSYGTLWSLRYRKPKDVLTSIYFALRDARDAERERQLRLLENEIAKTKTICGDHRNSVHEAEAMVREANGEEEA